MKLYLSVDKPAINGYMSIDLATQSIDFNNMNAICEASECIEMILDEMLHFVDIQQIPGVLQKLISRIRKGGKIIIAGFDINETTKAYINGILSIADLNLVLFGIGNIKKLSCFSHNDIQNIIVSTGLRISSVDIINNKFTIVAERV